MKKAQEPAVVEETVEEKIAVGPTKTVEEWRAEKKTDPAFFAATKAFYAWPIGLLISEKDFVNAIEHVTEKPRYGGLIADEKG